MKPPLPLVALGGAILAGIFLWRLEPATPNWTGEEDAAAMGRLVYISEGCIHCHSQYVRPVGEDIRLWGKPTEPETALRQMPVLIGNRRQGPDLANVALRRNRDWNRLHLIQPGAITPGSRMPSYAHLFEGEGIRGEALLSYLNRLKPPEIEEEKER